MLIIFTYNLLNNIATSINFLIVVFLVFSVFFVFCQTFCYKFKTWISTKPFFLFLAGVKLNYHVNLDVENKNGKEYFKLKSSSLKAIIDYSHTYFENLFGKNEELNRRANQIFNENYKVFLEQFTPVVEHIVEEFVNHVLSNFFKKFSLDVIFPKKK